MKIPFNKPFLTGKEAHYLYQAVYSGKISGNGQYTQLCHRFFQERYGYYKCLLTTSCTDALEMAAILIDIQPGDEVIMPAYTFVSTANAFVLRGAIIRFADSLPNHPNIDPSRLEELITPKTKAIVPVHYAGVACDMDPIIVLAKKYGLYVIEDAAQAIDARYKGKPLGSFGQLSAFSFHETKNIIAGEGGMLAINDPVFAERAEIIWEKGTNRAAFGRKEVNKYGWVDIGSSFLPAEIVSAFLYAQLENIDSIQLRRCAIWDRYEVELKPLAEKGYFRLPEIPAYSSNNAHIFYLVTAGVEERDALIRHLANAGILATFHYLSLHKSPFYEAKHDGRDLQYADYFTERLVRLPLYYELSNTDQQLVIDQIYSFYKQNKNSA